MLRQYLANLGTGIAFLARATVGNYHPNGDGWVHSWWYCLDCLANAVAGGDPHETISSRSGKARANGQKWACRLCGFLAMITATDHCAQSIQPDKGSRAVIPD